MAKFKDPDTGEVVLEITQYSYSYSKKIYKDKFEKELRNKDGKPLELIEEVKKDWSDPSNLPSFLAFGSKSDEEKKKILTQRSRNRKIQDNRELRDKKEWIDGKGVEKKKPKKIIPMSTKKKK